MSYDQKIMEALGASLPEAVKAKVEAVVKEFVTTTEAAIKADLEKGIEAKVAEAVKASEEVAYKGYAEAASVITGLTAKNESMKAEYENHMTEQFGEAAKLLEAEKAKTVELEAKMYETYEGKIKEDKAALVAKLDSFLSAEMADIRTQVEAEVKSDPKFVASKLAFDRVAEVVAAHMGDSHLTTRQVSEVEELKKAISALQAEVKVVKGKNVRLATENADIAKKFDALNESTAAAAKLAESVAAEQETKEKNERKEAAEQVKGTTETVKQEDVVKEDTAPAAAPKAETQNKTILEGIEHFELLAGLPMKK